MKALIRSSLIGMIVGLAVAWLAACQPGRNSDAWEKYHNSYQPPEQVMDSIGVKPGMVIAEVGAGRGRYVVHIARRVGDAGKVYANDIDEDKLEYLKFRCKRDNIPNIMTVLGKVTDPLLPAGGMDMVYVVNSYHHFEKPIELMKNIAPSLKSEGTLVIIEHDPMKVPDMGSHSTAKEVVLDQTNQAGFELVRIQTFLKKDNIYILRVKK